MSRFFLAALSLSIGATMMAGAGLDLSSQAALRQLRQERTTNSKLKMPKRSMTIPGESQSAKALVLIRLAANATEGNLSDEGVEVMSRRGNICVAAVDVDDMERIASLESVSRLQISRQLRPMLNEARLAAGVDKVQYGTDLPMVYTGKGVITGIVDSGVDPNHINFMDSDGKTRIKQLTHIRANAAGTDQITTTYTNNEDDINNISYFKTDDATSYHGTHTMGIMAGGYRGNLEYAIKVGEHDSEIHTDEPNPFYGVAYGSDIVASCGDLGDGYIAYGVDGILDYAYEHQQPCVINLSLGSNTGGHDGKDMLNEYLTLAGKEAIICVSAGNEGNLPVAISKTLESDGETIKTFIHNYYFTSGTYAGLTYGAQYVYSNDETPINVQFVIYSKSRNRIAQRFVIPSSGSGSSTYYISSSDYKQSSTDVVSAQLGNYCDGYVGIGSGFDSGSGRFYALIDIYLTVKDDNYLLGITASGSAGQRIDFYSDAIGTYYKSYDIDGWTDGSCNGSINSMACGDNVVVVGSYNTRDDWGCLDGIVRGYDTYYLPGEMSSFTSYGTLIDGRNLPHVCAPGADIVSSTSTYYLDAALSGGELTEGALQARHVGEKRPNYWQIAAGTSMSSPFVAGSIALWLEADPTLTYDDVIDIIKTTAVQDEYVTDAKYGVDPIQWGAGKFDAYAGLKEVLSRQASIGGIGNITSDNDNRLLVKALGDNRYNVFLAGEQLAINVYSTLGGLVEAVSTVGNETDIDLSGLASGVYIINVNGRFSQRILVK
jgi:hypothetical protein